MNFKFSIVFKKILKKFKLKLLSLKLIKLKLKLNKLKIKSPSLPPRPHRVTCYRKQSVKFIRKFGSKL